MFRSDLITDPGSADLDLTGAFDTQGNWYLPTTLKYTPADWQTEFSVGFDSLNSIPGSQPNRTTTFSNYVNIAATTAFDPSEHFSWAFAPLLTALLRTDSGVRLGAAAYGRYDRASNIFSATATWTGATTPSVSNPAGLFDFQAGYGRVFGKFTPYANYQFERATGAGRLYSVFAGISYDVNENLSLDISSQNFGINTAAPDHQIVAGLSWTFYRSHQ